MNPDLDKILDQLQKRMTPASPDEQERRERESSARRMEEALIVQRALGNEAGQELLQLLARKFGAAKEFDAQLGFFDGAAVGFQRTGSKLILDYLATQLHVAKEGTPHGERNIETRSAPAARKKAAKRERR